MNSGESTSLRGDSKGVQENGADTSSEYRPHKKARFPWQIKGKHHLKTQKKEQAETPANGKTLEMSESPASPEPLILPETRINACTLSETVIPPLSETPIGQQTTLEDELNKLETFDLKFLRYTQTCNGRPTVIIDTPEMPLETVVAIAQNMLLKAILPKESDSDSSTNTKPETSRRESKRQAKRLRRQEEKCIARWQSNQTVKASFDNNINRVIESWMNTSDGPRDDNDERSPLDYAHIMYDNNSDNDDNVENEGILMAINAHGLQNMDGAPYVGVRATEPVEGLANAIASASPMFVVESSNSSICSEDLQLYYEKTHHLWPDENVPQQPTEPEELNFNTYHRAIAECNDTLMDAAVMEAIRSKGLIKAGTDFG